MNYDCGAFAGHWPFRYLRNAALPEGHFGGGLVSSLDAIFYNDPWEGDIRLLEALEDGWKLAMCLNPRLPWWREELPKAYALGVRHLRLYPGIHGYGPEEGEVVCRAAAALGMTVLVTARMEDERLTYLLDQRAVSAEDWAKLAEKTGVRMMLSGFYLAELMDLETIPETLWADTAGLCHGLDPISALIKGGFPGERIVFGSFSPLLTVQSQLLNLPEAEKNDILSNNPLRILEV